MSVGHAARIFEEAGIPTVVVAVAAFEETLVSMSLPRVLLTPFPMGRPVGLPGNKNQHTRVVTAALKLLAEATGPRTVITLDEDYLG